MVRVKKITKLIYMSKFVKVMTVDYFSGHDV